MAEAVRKTDREGILGTKISFDEKGDVANPFLSVYQVQGTDFVSVKTVTK